MASLADFPPISRCAACGACCKALPGQFYPADLGITEAERVAKARQLLTTGRYAIDWWEGDVVPDGDMPVIYHLRPAVAGKEGAIFDPSWGGECTFLTVDGCSLDRAERPHICRALKPLPGDDEACEGLGKDDLAAAWRADSGWLGKLGDEMALIEAEATPCAA